MNGHIWEWKERREKKTRSRAVTVAGVSSTQISKFPAPRHTPPKSTQAEEAPRLK